MAEHKAPADLSDEDRREMRRKKKRVYMLAYYYANHEKIRAQIRENNRRDPSKRAKVRARYKANIKEYNRKYLAEHKDEINAKRRERYRRDPEKIKAQIKNWAKKNPEAAKAKQRRCLEVRAARKNGGDRIHRDDVYELDSHTCYLCGTHVLRENVSLDHVIPLCNGGRHIRANVRLAHRSCNARKNRYLPSDLDWVITTARKAERVARKAIADWNVVFPDPTPDGMVMDCDGKYRERKRGAAAPR